MSLDLSNSSGKLKDTLPITQFFSQGTPVIHNFQSYHDFYKLNNQRLLIDRFGLIEQANKSPDNHHATMKLFKLYKIFLSSKHLIRIQGSFSDETI